MKEKHAIPTIFGACSLIVIFSVLCLVVFSLLSLSTSGAGNRLSEISADHIAAYYRADVTAQEILAELRSGKMLDGVTKNGDVYSYECPISDVMELSVEVKLDGGAYTVLRWQSIRTEPWQMDEHIDVWDPTILE